LNKLTIDFYDRPDVLQIARELIGKILVTKLGGKVTSGRIVETEAYVAIVDKASHSYGGKRTARNEHMYAAAGTTYVYICYGIHHLFNIVTNKKEIPDAVLIRALEPLEGIETMLKRTGKKKADNTLTKGPGNVAKALGISKRQSGFSILNDKLFIAEDGFIMKDKNITVTKRIGIDGAGDAAFLPYRFLLNTSAYISGSIK